MDYFFMNECIFKLLIIYHKKFIIKLLKSINISIEDFELFNIDKSSKKVKVDILLFTKDTIINIQLNKNKKSLKRNKIYIECLNKILPDYKLIQININTFKENNYLLNNIKIYNLYKTNEYIKFITSKYYINFKTKSKYILSIIKYFNNINKKTFKKAIEKEQKIKNELDNLIKE